MADPIEDGELRKLIELGKLATREGVRRTDDERDFSTMSARLAIPLAQEVLRLREENAGLRSDQARTHDEKVVLLFPGMVYLKREKLEALREENERLRAWTQSITIGPLDPFNRPESRIHRALSFARQHGYHETDEAFTELHGMRAENSTLRTERDELREDLRDVDQRLQELEDAIRLDHEEGRAEVDKANDEHGYDSLRFADVRHGWLYSTRRGQAILNGGRVRFGDGKPSAKREALEFLDAQLWNHGFDAGGRMRSAVLRALGRGPLRDDEYRRVIADGENWAGGSPKSAIANGGATRMSGMEAGREATAATAGAGSSRSSMPDANPEAASPTPQEDASHA